MHGRGRKGNRTIEYCLENIKDRNQKDPRHFLKPTEEEIDELTVGDLVRLMFLLDKPLNNGCRAERMWVTIKEINPNHYVGILENQPYYITEITAGDEVRFMRYNIATLFTHWEERFDRQKQAIITRRALDKWEINRAIRTEELIDEHDSGWQFFYGDEDREYINTPHTAILITIEEALRIEPLLESIICKRGEVYRFDKARNAFVEDNVNAEKNM